MRWVPKVAPPCVLRAVDAGVLGPFGAENGPVCVGVIARVEAAMRREVASVVLAGSMFFETALAQTHSIRHVKVAIMVSCRDGQESTEQSGALQLLWS